MSNIPIHEFDGDVNVGRNINVGGRMNVQGSATIQHNLKVSGTLDAPNIKTPFKGLYATLAELNAAYPIPEAGWYALVGDTIPAKIYEVNTNHQWYDTGNTGGQMIVPIEAIEVESEEKMKEMIAQGLVVPTKLYYVAEED